MLIKAREGLLIRDPVTRMHIPPEGLDVPDDNLFWQRRLRDGDVERVSETVGAFEEAGPVSTSNSNQIANRE